MSRQLALLLALSMGLLVAGVLWLILELTAGLGPALGYVFATSALLAYSDAKKAPPRS